MHPVLKTVLGRLGLGLATLFIVSIIIFSSIEMLPGDFGQAILGQAATEETVAAFRRELGLDEPPYIRYFQWLGGAVQGDLGTFLAEMHLAKIVQRSHDLIVHAYGILFSWLVLQLLLQYPFHYFWGSPVLCTAILFMTEQSIQLL